MAQTDESANRDNGWVGYKSMLRQCVSDLGEIGQPIIGKD